MRILSSCLIMMFRVRCCMDTSIADWNALSQGWAVKRRTFFPGHWRVQKPTSCWVLANLFGAGRRWEEVVVDDMFTARPIWGCHTNSGFDVYSTVSSLGSLLSLFPHVNSYLQQCRNTSLTTAGDSGGQANNQPCAYSLSFYSYNEAEHDRRR